MKVRRGKTAILVICSFIIMILVITIGVAFVAESTVSNFSKDCKNFDRVLSCMSQYMQKEMYRTGKVPQNDDFFTFGDDFLDDNTELYVINGKKEIVAKSDNASKDFSYNSISKNDFYHIETSDIVNYIMSSDETANDAAIIASFRDLRFLMNNEKYIWFEKDFVTMGGSVFKVVAKRPASLSQDSSSAVVVTIGIFVLISSLFFISLVIIISFQAHSEHRLRKAAYYDVVTNSYNFTKFKMLSHHFFRKNKNNKTALVILNIGDFMW